MAKDLLTQSYIDHFLQAEIISRLAQSERPLRFSELKEPGVENSLFMYHANKLIDRGLVRKQNGGFELTIKGARWANHAGVLHSFSLLTPRPLVQFVVRDTEGRLLLAVRKGQLKQLLNDYLFPGNIFRHGLTLQENTTLILKELFEDGSPPTASLLTVAEVMHSFDDGFVNHVISYIFAAEVPAGMPFNDHPLFTTEWMPIDEVTTENPRFARSVFVPTFIEKLSSLQPHETFVFKSK